MSKRFKIISYTGQRVRRPWGDLVIDVAGMKAKESIPVLREHERDRIAGFSDACSVEDGCFIIEGIMSDATLDGREISALADEGFPWQASVGAWAQKVESLPENSVARVNGRMESGPLDIWRESMVGEVSFCVLGADDATSAEVSEQNKASTGNDDQLRVEFARDKDLQAEFGKEEIYLAFKKAEAQGLVRIL